MKTVYTSLSKAEVRAEIIKVANSSSLEQDILDKCAALGNTPEVLHARPAAKVATFLAFIENQLTHIDDHILKVSGIGKTLGTLSRHPDETVRNWAIRLRFALRAEWKAQQDRKRPRVSLPDGNVWVTMKLRQSLVAQNVRVCACT